VSVGLTRDDKHRYRWNDGPLVPGVTTVQGMKDKSDALVGWAKREVAACAVRNIDMLTQMVATGGPASAEAWLKGLPDYQRDSSADLGSSVHALAEQIALGQDPVINEAEAPFIESYRRDFLERYRPEFRAVEFMVYSERYQYGGTGDAFCVIDGVTWLIDYKTGGDFHTGKGVYPEAALQLAGLQWADWIGLPNDPKKYRIPQADRFGIVHVRPEGARLIPFDVGAEDFNTFLACRRIYGWVQGRAPFIKQKELAAA
jgi:hypothetical protein